jgi:hypothetical protein
VHHQGRQQLDHHEPGWRTNRRQARCDIEAAERPRHGVQFPQHWVADIDACYKEWSAKGATFLTSPIDRKAELRCYLRDPDGYLIEVGQATGLLEGTLADTGDS